MELKGTLTPVGKINGILSLVRGADGKTPVKGVDYFTATEVAEIINTVLGSADAKYVALESGKGLSTNDYTDTDKAEVEKVKDKVGFTDYATDTKAGVVKVYGIKGIKVDKTGEIGLNVPNETAIAQRLPANSNLPITIGNLDYAVRSVRPKVDTTLPTTLSVNTIYALDYVYPSLSLSLPSGKRGDFIQVDFSSGATPTNLTITSNNGLSDIYLNPEANTTYSLYFDYGIIHADDDNNVFYGWRFGYAEYPYEEV